MCFMIVEKNVSLFWRIRKSGESRISSPWRYHWTRRGGPPRTLHSRTTTWPSDAWASCKSYKEKAFISQRGVKTVERGHEKKERVSDVWPVKEKKVDPVMKRINLLQKRRMEIDGRCREKEGGLTKSSEGRILFLNVTTNFHRSGNHLPTSCPLKELEDKMTIHLFTVGFFSSGK